jgi:predicted Zn-ribbon and HTH transcriptional regulator
MTTQRQPGQGYNEWKRIVLKEWLLMTTHKDPVQIQADEEWVDSLHGAELAAIQTPGDCYLWRGHAMWEERMKKARVCPHCKGTEWIHEGKDWVCTGCLHIWNS